MSFMRPVKLQPLRLEVAASQSWTQCVLKVLRQHKHLFADHLCLRTIRTKLGEYLKLRIPASICFSRNGQLPLEDTCSLTLETLLLKNQFMSMNLETL
jgi:hypothetical protein